MKVTLPLVHPKTKQTRAKHLRLASGQGEAGTYRVRGCCPCVRLWSPASSYARTCMWPAVFMQCSAHALRDQFANIAIITNNNLCRRASDAASCRENPGQYRAKGKGSIEVARTTKTQNATAMTMHTSVSVLHNKSGLAKLAGKNCIRRWQKHRK